MAFSSRQIATAITCSILLLICSCLAKELADNYVSTQSPLFAIGRPLTRMVVPVIQLAGAGRPVHQLDAIVEVGNGMLIGEDLTATLTEK